MRQRSAGMMRRSRRVQGVSTENANWSKRTNRARIMLLSRCLLCGPVTWDLVQAVMFPRSSGKRNLGITWIGMGRRNHQATRGSRDSACHIKYFGQDRKQFRTCSHVRPTKLAPRIPIFSTIMPSRVEHKQHYLCLAIKATIWELPWLRRYLYHQWNP